MIESGNVVITNNARPSLYNRYRNTLGGGGRGRGGGLLQATRFRNSIAPAEPRVSLLPLGINILSATASQRAQVEGWMKQKCDEAATPAGKKTASDATKSIQKVRFQESPGGKDAEEDEGRGKGKVPTVHTPYVSKFDKNGSFMPPTAMRSALKNHRVNVNGLATPIPAARKLNFDDMSTIDDDESVVILDKENTQNDSSSIANSSNVSVMTGNLVQQCFRSITRLTQLELDQLSPDQVELIDQSFEMLKNYRTRIRMMGGKGGETQTARSGQHLVPITENEDDEEEEEVSDAFGALRIGGTVIPGVP
ncbi:hypothetical protein CAEBREN_28116 [Caenorhabditis brenneri]|uniref:Uncharacterized protein n=1 Tax=Caenorhabditis brenneri TaxID=135651 RepID=G0NEB0_CAEBE|nr:hypothetical protein CAEBREN_28116 [Caenorhabditis brenneri]